MGEVVLLTTPGFLPTPYSGTMEQVATLAGRAAVAMSVESPEINVELFGRGGDAAARESSTARTVGHYYVRNGRQIIGLYASEASDLVFLTAIIAHELDHLRLLGEGRITTARKDHERLTDLLTVYLGFGIFTTNAALRYGKTLNRVGKDGEFPSLNTGRISIRVVTSGERSLLARYLPARRFPRK